MDQGEGKSLNLRERERERERERAISMNVVEMILGFVNFTVIVLIKMITASFSFQNSNEGWVKDVLD